MIDTNSIKEIHQFINENGLMPTISLFFGPGAKVQMPFSASVYAAEIEKLDLSVRSYNCLKRAGMQTVEQIMDAIHENKLNSIRNLGIKSIGEIRVKILEYGYSCLSEQKQLEFIGNMINLNK